MPPPLLIHGKNSCTIRLSSLPSARPLVRGIKAAITFPISFLDWAQVSCTAA